MALIASGAIVAACMLLGRVGVERASGTVIDRVSSVERLVRTRDSVRIDGVRVSYAATAGTLVLRDGRGHPAASMFYIAYVARGLGSTDRRPITFAYNGGPGVSSTSLNIGAFGPKIVAGLSIDHRDTPARLVDNPNSILAKTDLVFIDAIGTGFSRVIGATPGNAFYGVDEDGDAFARFIHRYVDLNGRSKSPKYLLGLSYGTTRSAVVANLLEKGGVRVSGVVLMSTVLDFPAVAGGPGQDLQYSLTLPTEAMIAAYDRELTFSPAAQARFLSDVGTFATGSYAEALARGDDLPANQRLSIARRLRAYTGLPIETILRSNLRIGPGLFASTLLSGRHRTVGLYDGRVSGPERSASGPIAAFDPSTTNESTAFAATVSQLLRETHYDDPSKTYVLTSLAVNEGWDWAETGPSGTNVTGDLAQAATTDTRLRILAMTGYYDLATPFRSTEYQLAHLGVASSVRRRIAIEYYHGGHMIFLDPMARIKMKQDLDRFYSYVVL